jgi:ectoine hydroxylase
MELNQTQMDLYKEKGYLILENLFSKEEMNQLVEDTRDFEEQKSLPNIICEENGEIRSIFAPHLNNDSFDRLYHEERLVRLAEQLLEDQVYLYQFKLNNKRAIVGDRWEWHQDFPYWYYDDGVKSSEMVSVMILFQDTKQIQGPMVFIPGSHKNGIVDFEEKVHLLENGGQKKAVSLMSSLNADLKYTIKHKLIKEIAEKEGIIVGEGEVGTCIFFHPNLFHASNANISPFERKTAVITYNNINNLPDNRENKRPEYICSRDFEAIKYKKNKVIFG